MDAAADSQDGKLVTPTIPIWAKPTKTPTFPIWGKPLVPDTTPAMEYSFQAAQQAAEVGIPPEGIEIEDGIRVMPDYSVVSNNQMIGSIDPATGSFIEREPAWWEKIGNIVKWLPPNIPTALIKDYGFAAIEKVDLPFMIQEQAKTVLNKKQAGKDLSEAEQGFLDFYEKEVGDPPDYNELLAKLHPAAPFALTWAGAKLDPSEELKKAYYDSVGIGTTLLQGLTAPLSIALFTAGGLGGATAMESRLAQIAARGGRVGKLAQVGQMAAAPVVGYERVAGAIVTRLSNRILSTANKLATRTVLRREATRLGIKLTAETEKKLITQYKIAFEQRLNRALVDWMVKNPNTPLSEATQQKVIAYLVQRVSPKWSAGKMLETLRKGATTEMLALASDRTAATVANMLPVAINQATGVSAVARAGLPAVTTPLPTVTGVAPTVTGVAPTITEAPTVAMAGWETVSGLPEGIKKSGDLYTVKDREILKQLNTIEDGSQVKIGKYLVKVKFSEGTKHYENASLLSTVEDFNTGKIQDVYVRPSYLDIFLSQVKEIKPLAVTPAVPEVTPPTVSPSKLRQSIMAAVKTKGLSESKYRALFKKVGGTRNLTEMSAEQLNKVLVAVQETRPIKIHSKNVITAKTENAIGALRNILIAEKKLTPEMYENLKKYLGLETDKYESRELFITERQARELIRQMNVEAEVGITEWDVRVAEGLVDKPELRASIDNLTSRIVRENKPKPKKDIAIPFRKTAAEISEFPNDVGLSGTMSILRALRRFQEQLGGREVTRIYENAEMMVEQRRLNDIILANTVNAMKMQAPQLATMIRDKEAMGRIQQWLDSDLKIVDIAKPDLAPAELEVAQLFRARYDQWKNAVRLERFKDAYYHYGGRAKEVVAELIKHGTEGTSDVAIPDAPLKDIKEAITIYEAQGETALREYLNTKDWGVLKSGYSFSQILHPKLRMYRGTSVKATTTSLHQRKGLDFLRDERTPWERLIAYERQMIGLNLQPYYRKMDTEFRKGIESGRISPESARDAANKISLFMREVKGYPIESPVVALLLRIGGWSFGTLSKVPWMSVRNLHQNIAFGADKSEIIKAIATKGFFRNPLTKRGRLDYTDALVHQYKGVTQEQMLMGYMGRTPLENLIRKTDYYHLSDKLNRYLCMAGQGAKAEVALGQYLKDGNAGKFLENSGANELSATEQIRILEYLALETYDYGGVLESVSGGEAAIRDIASKITTLIHFNYVRYLRSAMEMGESGRIIGSLVAFPRSVVERYVDIFSRTKRLGGADRKRAIHSLMAMVIGSAIASALLSQITGKKRDAYNPLLVLQWQVGGLALGATQELMEFYRLLSNLTFAEEEGQKKFYMDELVTLVPRLGDMFIPFYAPTMNLLESLTSSRYLDRKQLRQIREVFDENYELNEEYYKIERDWLERVQHGLFGTNTPDPSDLEQALKGLEGIRERLGQIDTEEFEKARQKAEEAGRLEEWSARYTEEDYLYTTSNLGSDINSAIYGLDPSEITAENGFSDLVLEYMEYQALFEEYKWSPPDKRYEYREENPEVDANLFFWSYVVTLQSDTAKGLVEQMISRFGVPPTSIRGYGKVFEAEEGGIPVWGEGETQEPTIPTETPGGTPTIPTWGK